MRDWLEVTAVFVWAMALVGLVFAIPVAVIVLAVRLALKL